MSIATERRIFPLRTVHDDRWVKGEVVDVEFNNGKTIKNFLMLTGKGGGFVSVCPRMQNGDFLLVRQCKPVAGLSYESPAGGIEVHETWLEAAVREFLEETGHEAERYELIGTSSGIHTQTDRINNPCRLILAYNCFPSKKSAEGDEVQGVQHYRVPVVHALQMIKEGEIRDMSTVAGIYAHLYQELRRPGE